MTIGRLRWIVRGLLVLLGVAAGPVTAAEALTPVPLYTPESAPAAPRVEDLPLQTSVSRFGVTWTFAQPARCGRFINGDWYVVGPVTVVAIDPAPQTGKDLRNGFMVNPPAKIHVGAYDSRMPHMAWFKPELTQRLPAAMKPGDAMLSSISRDKPDKGGLPVKSFAVLTCLQGPVPADAFRPGYSDREQKVYLARELRRERLPRLAAPRLAAVPEPVPEDAAPVSNKAMPTLERCREIFHRPWNQMAILEDAEAEYQFGGYGRGICQWVGNATLLLCLDFKPEDKEPLLVDMVEHGLDLWGFAKTEGFAGWPTLGGWGSGRKWPIVFAGLMLGDEAMASPTKTYPRLSFQEDNQTHYDECWTGANVVYAGHVGWHCEAPAKRALGWGPYEHVHPSRWVDWIGTSYRTNMTSSTWIGQGLAIRLLQAEKEWNNAAHLDYLDRWMYEPDPGYRNPLAFSTQGHGWDAFAEAMWKKYREQLPNLPGLANAPRPVNGWQKQRPLLGPAVKVGANRELRVGERAMLPIMLFAETPARIADAEAIGANVLAEGCFEKPENAGQYWCLNTHDAALAGSAEARSFEKRTGIAWAAETTNRQFLDALAAKGMYGIFGADARTIGHPALLGWLHVDQPDVIVAQAAQVPEKQLRRTFPGFAVMKTSQSGGSTPELKDMPAEMLLVEPARQWMKRMDAGRPAFLTVGPAFLKAAAEGQKDALAGYLKNCDAIGCAVFPRGGKDATGRLEDVARAVSTLVELSPGKPVFAWVETRAVATPDQGARAVRPQDIRAEVWMALIGGATGIGYRGFEGLDPRVKPDEPVMVELKRLNLRLATLAPALLASPAKAGVKMNLAAGAACHVRTTETGGAVFVFAQNLSEKAAGKATLELPGLRAGATVEVLDENRTLVAAEGKWVDEFGPLAEHVYRIQP